ncbi:MAG: DUF4126 domain-containing protein [Anaerolineales bacterium]
MVAVGGVLAAFGLAASAGLNAYIPLLVVALAARLTDWFKLGPTWEPLTSWWVIGVLVVLVAVEFIADKLPAVNHANDVIQTFVRPAAGAVLFAASTNVVTDINPVFAMIAGLLTAGSVHAVKSVAVRPAVSLTTGGIGNTPVSILEDLISTVLAILAVLIPVAVAIMMVLLTSFIIWLLWRNARRSTAAQSG